MPIDAIGVLCAQLTRDLLAIAKFLFYIIFTVLIKFVGRRERYDKLVT